MPPTARQGKARESRWRWRERTSLTSPLRPSAPTAQLLVLSSFAFSQLRASISMSLLHCSPPQALYSLLDDNAKRTPAGQALKQSELQQRINYAEFEKIQGEDFFRQARGQVSTSFASLASGLFSPPCAQSQQFDIKEASLSPDLYSLGRYHRDTLLASPVSLANCSPEIDSDVQIIVPRQVRSSALYLTTL